MIWGEHCLLEILNLNITYIVWNKHVAQQCLLWFLGCDTLVLQCLLAVDTNQLSHYPFILFIDSLYRNKLYKYQESEKIA